MQPWRRCALNNSFTPRTADGVFTIARVSRLVTINLEVRSLEKWRSFLYSMYGLTMQPSRRTGEFEALLDDQGSRLLFREGPADDAVAAGFISDDLDGLHDQLSAFGAKAEWLSDDEAPLLGAGRVLCSEDPLGLRIEIMDQTSAQGTFQPADHNLVYVTEDLGIGHMAFATPDDRDALESYYINALGMQVTDYNEAELGAGIKILGSFYRANGRHHSVATVDIPNRGRRLHHFMLEVTDRNGVGMSYERVVKAGVPIALTVGAHPNDNVMSFYAISPSGFECELGTDGLIIPDDYEPVTFYGPILWGMKVPLRTLPRQLWLLVRLLAHRLLARRSLFVRKSAKNSAPAPGAQGH